MDNTVKDSFIDDSKKRKQPYFSTKYGRYYKIEEEEKEAKEEEENNDSLSEIRSKSNKVDLLSHLMKKQDKKLFKHIKFDDEEDKNKEQEIYLNSILKEDEALEIESPEEEEKYEDNKNSSSSKSSLSSFTTLDLYNITPLERNNSKSNSILYDDTTDELERTIAKLKSEYKSEYKSKSNFFNLNNLPTIDEYNNYENYYQESLYSLPVELFEESLNNFNVENKEIKLPKKELLKEDIEEKKSYIRKTLALFFTFNIAISFEFYFADLILKNYFPDKIDYFDSNIFKYVFISTAIICFLGAFLINISRYKNSGKNNKKFKSLSTWNILNFTAFLTTFSLTMVGYSFYKLFLNSNITKINNSAISLISKVNFSIGITLLCLTFLGMLHLKLKNRGIFKDRKYLSNVLLAFGFSFLMYSGLFTYGHKIYSQIKRTDAFFYKIGLFKNYILYPLIIISSLTVVLIFLLIIKATMNNEEYYNNKDKNIRKIKRLTLLLYSFISVLLIHFVNSYNLNVNKNILYSFIVIALGIFLNDLINRFILYINDKALHFKSSDPKNKKITNLICPILFFTSLSLFCLSFNFYNVSSNVVNSFNSNSLTLFISGIIFLSLGILLSKLESKSSEFNLNNKMHIGSNTKSNNNRTPRSTLFRLFKNEDVDNYYNLNNISSSSISSDSKSISLCSGTSNNNNL